MCLEKLLPLLLSVFLTLDSHYYSNDFSGEVGFFRKHEKFKPQSEYRIYISNSINEPIKIKIGSLEDIASLNTGFLKLTYTDKKEQLITL